MTSSSWPHGHIFKKWRHFFDDVACESNFKHKLRLFFDTESWNAYVKIVTSQKRIMTSFKLNIGQKITPEIKKLFATSAVSNFQELFANEFDCKSNWFVIFFFLFWRNLSQKNEKVEKCSRVKESYEQNVNLIKMCFGVIFWYSCRQTVESWRPGDDVTQAHWHRRDCPLMIGTDRRNVSVGELLICVWSDS